MLVFDNAADEADDESLCPHEIHMESHEVEAMDWLYELLGKTIDEGGEHAARASIVRQFIGTIARKQSATHRRVHELEHCLAFAAALAEGDGEAN